MNICGNAQHIRTKSSAT